MRTTSCSPVSSALPKLGFVRGLRAGFVAPGGELPRTRRRADAIVGRLDLRPGPTPEIVGGPTVDRAVWAEGSVPLVPDTPETTHAH